MIPPGDVTFKVIDDGAEPLMSNGLFNKSAKVLTTPLLVTYAWHPEGVFS